VTNHDDAIARLIYEAGMLKRMPRMGWHYASVGKGDVESVAEHSHRTAMIAWLLACIDGADANKAAAMSLWHDSQETRVTDIAYVGRRYLDAIDNPTVTEHQTAGVPSDVAEKLRGLIGEYEARESAEAVIARDADKLECLVQAREYQAAGQGDCSDWIKSMREALKTSTAQRLAEVMISMHPHEWWRHVVSEADELRNRPRS
jgi:putative hydrolase of HD superfamily